MVYGGWTYAGKFFRAAISRALAGRDPIHGRSCGRRSGFNADSNFQKVTLDNNLSNPLQLSVALDGKVFYIERGGNVKMI